MTTIIKFYRFDMSHVCDNGIGFAYDATKAGDMSGEYVPLAEYDKLKSLIQRVNEIGPNLGGNYAWQNEELSQLLKDCKEAVA